MTIKFSQKLRPALLVTTLLLIIGVATLLPGNETNITSSFASNDTQTLYVTANQLMIADMDCFASNFISDFKENNFKSMIFNHNESGLPTTLTVYVYQNALQKFIGLDPACITITNINADTPVFNIITY